MGKCHSKVGEYWTGGIGNFVELKVRGGDKLLEQRLKKCSKKTLYFKNFTEWFD